MPTFRKTKPEPMTRNLSLVIHERVYPSLRDYAEEKYDGNINLAVRLLVYAELIKSGHLNIELVKEISGA